MYLADLRVLVKPSPRNQLTCKFKASISSKFIIEVILIACFLVVVNVKSLPAGKIFDHWVLKNFLNSQLDPTFLAISVWP